MRHKISLRRCLKPLIILLSKKKSWIWANYSVTAQNVACHWALALHVGHKLVDHTENNYLHFQFIFSRTCCADWQDFYSDIFVSIKLIILSLLSTSGKTVHVSFFYTEQFFVIIYPFFEFFFKMGIFENSFREVLSGALMIPNI